MGLSREHNGNEVEKHRKWSGDKQPTLGNRELRFMDLRGGQWRKDLIFAGKKHRLKLVAVQWIAGKKAGSNAHSVIDEKCAGKRFAKLWVRRRVLWIMQAPTLNCTALDVCQQGKRQF